MTAIDQFLQQHPTISAWGKLGINAAVAIVVCFFLLKLEKKIAKRWISKFGGINARFTEKVVRFVIIFIAAMWVIMSNDITKSFGSSLFQGTAVLAAIAGFAAKPVLSDMLCGFMLSATKPFNIGDRIEMDDGTAGIVQDITIRHVVLKGIDTLKYVIPNSEMNAMRITNLSHQARMRSIHFRFSVGLYSDVDQVKKLIGDAIQSSPYTVPRDGGAYSPVYFIRYLPNGLEMAVTVYYEPGSPTEVVKDDVNCRVNSALNASKVEIPYDYMTVVMNGAQPSGKETAVS